MPTPPSGAGVTCFAGAIAFRGAGQGQSVLGSVRGLATPGSAFGLLCATDCLALIGIWREAPLRSAPLGPRQGIFAVVEGAPVLSASVSGEIAERGMDVSIPGPELVARSYEVWEEGAVPRLTGPLAAAVWDGLHDELLLARDRFGERALYYYANAEGLFFASRLAVLLAIPAVPRNPNLRAVHDYLSLGYCPEPATFFADIRAVPAAHYLKATRYGHWTVRRYWDLPSAAEQQPRAEPVLKRELIERLGRAVAGTAGRAPVLLATDPSLGAAVAGLLATDTGRKVAVASFCARKAAAKVRPAVGRTRRHRLGPEALASLADLVAFGGQPLFDANALGVHVVATAMEPNTHLVATLGGNEMLIGERRYFERNSRVTHAGSAATESMASSLFPGALTPREISVCRYANLLAAFSERDKLVGYDGALLPLLRDPSYKRLVRHAPENGGPETGSRIDLGDTLPCGTLRDYQTAAGLGAAELRLPFLEEDFADFMLNVPAHQRSWSGEPKALWNRAIAELPARAPRAARVGSGVQLRQLMNETAWSITRRLLLGAPFLKRGLLRPAFVEKLLARAAAGRRHDRRLWLSLCLEIWFLMWIDSAGPPGMGESANPFAALAG